MNSLALSRHTQLLEVLEIPQVMETCVRNGYYEEALDLSAHVRRMAKKHGTIPIIEVCPWCTCNHMGCRWGVPIAIKKIIVYLYKTQVCNENLSTSPLPRALAET